MDSYAAKMLYQSGVLNGQFSICATLRAAAGQYSKTSVDGEKLLLSIVNNIEQTFRNNATGEAVMWKQKS